MERVVLAAAVAVTKAVAARAMILVCPRGMGQQHGVGICGLCGAGTWGSGGGACEACPAGHWSSTVGASEASVCQACPAGKWNKQPGGVWPLSCRLCPAGRYGAYEGSSSKEDCKECRPGTYSTLTGLTAQGVWGPAAGGGCGTCPRGRYSGFSASNCSLCPKGTFGAKTGSSSCSACPLGRWSGIYGAQYEDECWQDDPNVESSAANSTSNPLSETDAGNASNGTANAMDRTEDGLGVDPPADDGTSNSSSETGTGTAPNGAGPASNSNGTVSQKRELRHVAGTGSDSPGTASNGARIASNLSEFNATARNASSGNAALGAREEGRLPPSLFRDSHGLVWVSTALILGFGACLAVHTYKDSICRHRTKRGAKVADGDEEDTGSTDSE